MPHTFGCPLYVWMPSCLDTPICLDAPMFEHPAVCLGDVWMPPIHIQHIESMLCHTKGVSICPHTFGCPHMCGCSLYVWMVPCMFECPICWTPPVCLLAPMFGHHPYFWMPHMFGHHPYIWMPPYVWMPCCMFGCPLYVWLSPYV